MSLNSNVLETAVYHHYSEKARDCTEDPSAQEAGLK